MAAVCLKGYGATGLFKSSHLHQVVADSFGMVLQLAELWDQLTDLDRGQEQYAHRSPLGLCVSQCG